jgi:hypothetical protein
MRNKAAKTTETSAAMQLPLITRSAIFSTAGDRPSGKSGYERHKQAGNRNDEKN